MSKPAITHQPVTFAELPGWMSDDHAAALQAFLKSCDRVMTAARSGRLISKVAVSPEILSACHEAATLLGPRPAAGAARIFFESHFVPHRVIHAKTDGMLTGYFEPVIEGSRHKRGPFQAPVYRRPPELMTLIDEAKGGATTAAPTHGRRTATGTIQPLPTRAEIDAGALAGRGLEIVYLKDGVDIFMMQIQGSGRIRLTDGTHVRVSYDGKNGHPYTSVGRYLIDNKLADADKMSLDMLAEWLRADPERGRKAMAQNASYVFFKELVGDGAKSAIGVLDIPLTAGRSLAIDAEVHGLGLPVFVSAPALTHVERNGFNRLMIAQDVGSAIKGPERGDIFFGSGVAAAKLAGVTRHPGTFFVLLPARPPQTGSIPTAPPSKRAQP